MDWEIAGVLGTWAGAAGVIVTLYYLAQQIGLNTRQIERQINADVGTRVFQSYDPIYQGHNAEIMIGGLRDDPGMSEADKYVFNLLMYRQHGAMVELCGAIRSGVVPEPLIEAYSRHYRQVLLAYPGAKKWFRARNEATQSELKTLRLTSALDEERAPGT